MAIRRGVLLLALVLLVGAFSSIPGRTAIESFNQTTDLHGDPAYLSAVDFQPEGAEFYDLVDSQLTISEAERATLAANGFVVTDRHAFPNFVEGYAWIYWRDLPVLITTDSILYAAQKSYEQILTRTEQAYFAPYLEDLLARTEYQLGEKSRESSVPAEVYEDLNIYVRTARALLKEQAPSDPRALAYYNLAVAADGITEIDFLGQTHLIDFTQFKPRGHYNDENVWLSGYFRAMMWLAQIDFRFVNYDSQGLPIVSLDAIAGAAVLRQAMAESDALNIWTQLDDGLAVLVGRSDNMTIYGLEQFLADMTIESPSDVYQLDQETIFNQLTTLDYGWQQIGAQPLDTAPGRTESLPQPVSFMLLGQRFTLDSFIMSELTSDRLTVDDVPVQRAYPSPLDVMAALGNPHAEAHLTDELATYGYEENLHTLQEVVNNLPPSFWNENSYHRWLGMLRSLGTQTTDAAYPQAMRTEAWADKMLQTQLAGWTQLRHANTLYVTEPIVNALCQYPAGYVEPYPEFYAALREYARAGTALFNRMTPPNDSAESFRETAKHYFDHLTYVAGQLETLSEKELRLDPFTLEEEAFVRSMVVLQYVRSVWVDDTYIYQPFWDGWYVNLFYGEGNSEPELAASVHTNLSNFGPTGTLHVGIGQPRVMLFIGDTDEGHTMYVGPTSSYYEWIEESYPPARLTDEEWAARLNDHSAPPPPSWTGSFRLASESSETLRVNPNTSDWGGLQRSE